MKTKVTVVKQNSSVKVYQSVDKGKLNTLIHWANIACLFSTFTDESLSSTNKGKLTNGNARG